MELIQFDEIQNKIFTIRGVQVMLDSHLAEMYEIESKRLNEQVKRNIERFPDTYRFQLTEKEWDNIRTQIAGNKAAGYLRSQIATSSLEHGGRRYLPYVFTEQGVAMLSAVLRSETAVKVSIQIIDAFVQMRKMLFEHASLFQRIDKIELKQLESEQKFEQVFKALESRTQQPEKGIFFDGQVFDAYLFVADIIKRANRSIILIDNFVDETVLSLLSKRSESVAATIYTKTISKQLQLDRDKHNAQYPPIDIQLFTPSHDRFLIIDNAEMYHLGASLKDLGKKWFAFSKMDSLTVDVLAKLKNNDMA
jgi:phage regulator Rha-like protein